MTQLEYQRHIFPQPDYSGNTELVKSYNLSSSIWLVRSHFNVVLETVFIRSQTHSGPGSHGLDELDLSSSPGIRWSYNY